MSERNGGLGCLVVAGGLVLLLLGMCDWSGSGRYARMVTRDLGTQEKSTVDYTREGLRMLGRPLGELVFLGGAIVGCAVLGAAGRNGDPSKMPGSVKGLLLGIVVLPVVTLGGFANEMAFMDALHVGEAAALGLVGALALARVIGRGPPDRPNY